MLGLAKGKVEICPYDSEWAALFAQECEAIREQLGDLISDIQHFGSTAVPKLDAKPIIDIAIGVRSLDIIEICRPGIESLGYEYHGEFVKQGSIFFSKGTPTTHHAHFAEIDGIIYLEWLYFRDRLRQDDGVAREYLSLKKELEKKFENDREAYGRGKYDFIHRILDQME